MSLSRVTSAAATRLPSISCSCSAPSTRSRIRSRSSPGSMWMSEARAWTASWNIVCSSRTTGASGEPSSADRLSMSTSPSLSSSRTASASVAISSVWR